MISLGSRSGNRDARRDPLQAGGTGQYYDAAISAEVFDELRMPWPDVDLEVGSSHAQQTAIMSACGADVFRAAAT